MKKNLFDLLKTQKYAPCVKEIVMIGIEGPQAKNKIKSILKHCWIQSCFQVKNVPCV